MLSDRPDVLPSCRRPSCCRLSVKNCRRQSCCRWRRWRGTSRRRDEPCWRWDSCHQEALGEELPGHHPGHPWGPLIRKAGEEIEERAAELPAVNLATEEPLEKIVALLHLVLLVSDYVEGRTGSPPDPRPPHAR